MKAVIQRVSQARIKVSDKIISEIKLGFLILLGIEKSDFKEDIDWLVNKISNLRVFSDNELKMNLSIKDILGEIIVVSQFTLHHSIVPNLYNLMFVKWKDYFFYHLH